MGKRRRVLLLLPHLGGGGTERVSELLAWGLSPAKYDVHFGVITPQKHGHTPLPPWVSMHVLDVPRIRACARRLLLLIWRLRPDVIVSSAPHLNFVVLLLRPLLPPNTRVAVRQTRTASARFRDGRWSDHSRLLYRLLYPHADRIICQTAAMAKDIGDHTGIRFKQLDVLPNPVDLDSIRQRVTPPACWQGPGPHLLAFGRLAHEKGFDLLLQALVVVRRLHPGLELCLLGSGPERDALCKLVSRLGLAPNIRLLGHVDDPSAWFQGATLFVLPSRTEGLPNALLEAAAAGLPLVATPCSEGVRELLAGESGTWLADTHSFDALAACILHALASIQAGQRFEHSWVEAFHMGRAITHYEDLIDALTSESCS